MYLFLWKDRLGSKILQFLCLFGLRTMLLSQVTRDEMKEKNKENQ